jgi:LysW-gamma-L-lysine carboxypeptidase
MQIKNAFPMNPNDSPFNSVTACLTKMTGGLATSVIPFESEMHLDIRIPPQYTSTQLYGIIQRIVDDYKTANPKVAVKMALGDSVEPFEVTRSSPLVHALSSSVRKVVNKPATLIRKTGTGDMNILGHAMNMPIVTYGPGDSHLDHTVDEHIEIAEYLLGIEIYKETILKLSELHNNKSGNRTNGN